jgi:predicted metal-dependent peptidase
MSALRPDAELDALVRVEQALEMLGRRRPFYASVLAAARFVADATPTMAISVETTGLVIRFSPAFVLAIDSDQLVGVLVHEALHALLGHVDRSRFPPERYPDQAALQLAMDLVVNEWVFEPLPGRPPRVEDFAPLLSPGESTKVRYEKLVGRVPGAREPMSAAPSEALAPAAASMVVDEIAARALAGCSDDELALLPEEITRLGAAPGDAAGSSVETIARERPTGVAWAPIVRLAARRAQSEPAATRARPSRRAPALVGIVSGRRRKPARPAVVVAVDCSGSVSRAELELAAGGIRELSSLCAVKVVQFDTSVHAALPYRGELTRFRGRGGTDFASVFRPDVIEGAGLVVIMTDAEGPCSCPAPSIPVVWAIYPRGRGAAAQVPFGTVISLSGRTR